VTATLIVSLSGLSAPSLSDAAAFAAELDARLVPASWLLPPRPRDGRHLPDAPVIRWLHGRLAVGDAVVMHGFDHTVDPIGRWSTSPVAAMGRRAEFASLPCHEATLRLIAATRTMDELGLPSDVFAPPRWLASAGTLVALRRRGFRVCADSVGVRLLDTGAGDVRVLRGRVLGVGGGLGSRGAGLGGAGLRDGGLRGGGLVLRGGRASAMGGEHEASGGRARRGPVMSLVGAAARVARRGGLVRIAATAADLRRPTARQALVEALDAALSAGALPASYRAPEPTPTPSLTP
jgi:uncharacterized protein